MPKRRKTLTYYPTRPTKIRSFVKVRIIGRGKKRLSDTEALAWADSYSSWVKHDLLPAVKSSAPKYTGRDPRPRVIIKEHFGTIKRKWPGRNIYVEDFGIPGAKRVGSPAYRTLLAVMSLHEGWSFPYERRPVRKKVMTFPLERGETFRNPQTAARAPGATRGPKTWVITRRAVQARQIRKNPWIYITVRKLMPRLRRYYGRLLSLYMKEKRVIYSETSRT